MSVAKDDAPWLDSDEEEENDAGKGQEDQNEAQDNGCQQCNQSGSPPASDEAPAESQAKTLVEARNETEKPARRGHSQGGWLPNSDVAATAQAPEAPAEASAKASTETTVTVSDDGVEFDRNREHIQSRTPPASNLETAGASVGTSVGAATEALTAAEVTASLEAAVETAVQSIASEAASAQAKATTGPLRVKDGSACNVEPVEFGGVGRFSSGDKIDQSEITESAFCASLRSASLGFGKFADHYNTDMSSHSATELPATELTEVPPQSMTFTPTPKAPPQSLAFTPAPKVSRKKKGPPLSGSNAMPLGGSRLNDRKTGVGPAPSIKGSIAKCWQGRQNGETNATPDTGWQPPSQSFSSLAIPSVGGYAPVAYAEQVAAVWEGCVANELGPIFHSTFGGDVTESGDHHVESRDPLEMPWDRMPPVEPFSKSDVNIGMQGPILEEEDLDMDHETMAHDETAVTSSRGSEPQSSDNHDQSIIGPNGIIRLHPVDTSKREDRKQVRRIHKIAKRKLEGMTLEDQQRCLHEQEKVFRKRGIRKRGREPLCVPPLPPPPKPPSWLQEPQLINADAPPLRNPAELVHMEPLLNPQEVMQVDQQCVPISLQDQNLPPELLQEIQAHDLQLQMQMQQEYLMQMQSASQTSQEATWNPAGSLSESVNDFQNQVAAQGHVGTQFRQAVEPEQEEFTSAVVVEAMASKRTIRGVGGFVKILQKKYGCNPGEICQVISDGGGFWHLKGGRTILKSHLCEGWEWITGTSDPNTQLELAAHLDLASTASGSAHSIPAQKPRDGDWISRNSQASREGDWVCPKCHDLQFARNQICRRCSTGRPCSDLRSDVVCQVLGLGANLGEEPVTLGQQTEAASVPDQHSLMLNQLNPVVTSQQNQNLPPELLQEIQAHDRQLQMQMQQVATSQQAVTPSLLPNPMSLNEAQKHATLATAKMDIEAKHVAAVGDETQSTTKGVVDTMFATRRRQSMWDISPLQLNEPPIRSDVDIPSPKNKPKVVVDIEPSPLNLGEVFHRQGQSQESVWSTKEFPEPVANRPTERSNAKKEIGEKSKEQTSEKVNPENPSVPISGAAETQQEPKMSALEIARKAVADAELQRKSAKFTTEAPSSPQAQSAIAPCRPETKQREAKKQLKTAGKEDILANYIAESSATEAAEATQAAKATEGGKMKKATAKEDTLANYIAESSATEAAEATQAAKATDAAKGGKMKKAAAKDDMLAKYIAESSATEAAKELVAHKKDSVAPREATKDLVATNKQPGMPRRTSSQANQVERPPKRKREDGQPGRQKAERAQVASNLSQILLDKINADAEKEAAAEVKKIRRALKGNDAQTSPKRAKLEPPKAIKDEEEPGKAQKQSKRAREPSRAVKAIKDEEEPWKAQAEPMWTRDEPQEAIKTEQESDKKATEKVISNGNQLQKRSEPAQKMVKTEAQVDNEAEDEAERARALELQRRTIELQKLLGIYKPDKAEAGPKQKQEVANEMKEEATDVLVSSVRKVVDQSPQAAEKAAKVKKIAAEKAFLKRAAAVKKAAAMEKAAKEKAEELKRERAAKAAIHKAEELKRERAAKETQKKSEDEEEDAEEEEEDPEADKDVEGESLTSSVSFQTLRESAQPNSVLQKLRVKSAETQQDCLEPPVKTKSQRYSSSSKPNAKSQAVMTPEGNAGCKKKTPGSSVITPKKIGVPKGQSRFNSKRNINRCLSGATDVKEEELDMNEHCDSSTGKTHLNSYTEVPSNQKTSVAVQMEAARAEKLRTALRSAWRPVAKKNELANSTKSARLQVANSRNQSNASTNAQPVQESEVDFSGVDFDEL